MRGATPTQALERASSGVFDMVARSVRAGADELQLAAEQAVLDQTLAQVTLRQIGEILLVVRGQNRLANARTMSCQ